MSGLSDEDVLVIRGELRRLRVGQELLLAAYLHEHKLDLEDVVTDYLAGIDRVQTAWREAPESGHG